MPETEFSKRLTSAMFDKGLNDKQVGAMMTSKYAVYANSQTVKRWREGENEPTGPRIAALCKALDISSDWLFGLKAQGKRQKAAS